MLVISLYWFAAEQQANRSRRQKSHSIYSKFGVPKNELTPRFQNQQELAIKLQKRNNARNSYVYVFQGLTVKALVTNVQKHPIQNFLVFS